MLLLIVTDCATTQLTGSWLNPEYQGNGFNKILVLGVSENETYLRIFEDTLSMKLENRGIMAEPGYILFDTEKRPVREAISKEISRIGFDALIVSKVTGRRTEEVVHPGEFYYVRDPSFVSHFYGWRHPYPPRFYDNHWFDYYSWSYTIVHEPGYVTEYEVMTVESNIYDAGTDELIWSGVTDTIVQAMIEDTINSLVNTLIQELAKKQLI